MIAKVENDKKKKKMHFTETATTFSVVLDSSDE